MQLNQSDLELFKSKEISEKDIEKQLEIFKKGIPHVNIIGHAKIGNGISKIPEDLKESYIKLYEESSVKSVKFTPSSGAATRMFKVVHSFFNTTELNEVDISKAIEKEDYKIIKQLIKGIEKLAFYKEALQVAKTKYPESADKSDLVKKTYILKAAIDKTGLNLAEFPKGLIPFHTYKNKVLNPFEEHLDESKFYTKKNSKTFLNFSISEQHNDKFKAALKSYLEKYNHYDTDFEVSFSFQKPSTDTVAVNLDNSPFRDNNGNLVFRPGGHGALIHNLNQIDADIIFIKNIDNVSKRENDKNDTIAYKKVLAGFLISIQNQVYAFQKNLKSSENQLIIEECRDFMKDTLNITNPSHSAKSLIKELKKPIRVCGMVKNDGDPGGGPFWIEEDGKISLQIVETSQIDTKKADQKEILSSATHFNPVDIVCGVKDYEGNKFDLHNFINPNRGFITQKSIDGKDIKALELPGLWNGAMEHWHSVFVEVPASTFNPVKTIADLLKPAHQDG